MKLHTNGLLVQVRPYQNNLRHNNPPSPWLTAAGVDVYCVFQSTQAEFADYVGKQAGVVARCKLNPVPTHSLKTPGFNSTLEPEM
jgi:hypothetical protein